MGTWDCERSQIQILDKLKYLLTEISYLANYVHIQIFMCLKFPNNYSLCINWQKKLLKPVVFEKFSVLSYCYIL